MNPTIKVLAICKKGTFIEAIRPLLNINKIEVIGCCNNKFTGIELYKRDNPNIVIIDANWPDHSYSFSGLDIVRELKMLNHNCKIIIVTNYNELQTVQKFTGYVNGYFYRTMTNVLPFMIECICEVNNSKKYFPITEPA